MSRLQIEREVQRRMKKVSPTLQARAEAYAKDQYRLQRILQYRLLCYEAENLIRVGLRKRRRPRNFPA
jgi:hypothetical protein